MKLTVNITDHSYDILIQNGLLHKIGELIQPVIGSGTCVIITDSNVDRLHCAAAEASLRKQGFSVLKFVFPAGEPSKSFDTLLKIYAFLADNKINRGNFILALGGGVTGDIAGFAAATYMRGVKYVQVPTTLLAQVDSSVGGKVAVDMPQGKNMVGNFYHPKLVLIDPSVLQTLSPEFFADGMAEVIKYGCIKDEALFDYLSACTADELNNKMDEIIYKCVDIKRKIVEQDEKDTGERMLLNFGHTLGHAIEKYYNFEGITHGMAVSIGMYLMATAGERLGITQANTAERIKNCLKKYLLPTDANHDIIEKIPAFAAGDKKNFGSLINLIMLKKIGDSFIYKISYDEFKQWNGDFYGY